MRNKRLLMLMLCFSMVCLLFYVSAEAQATDAWTPAFPEQAQSPFEWEYLATIAGASAAALLIVQFATVTKPKVLSVCRRQTDAAQFKKFRRIAMVPLDKVWKIPTRLLVYLLCLGILLTATHFVDGLTIRNALLAALNAFVSALAAYGAYEITFAKREKG